jgi:hypothetical protein
LIRVVEPQDMNLLAPTAEDALTLIICFPLGRGPHSPQRFVVRALPLEAGHLVPKLSGSGQAGGRIRSRWFFAQILGKIKAVPAGFTINDNIFEC